MYGKSLLFSTRVVRCNSVRYKSGSSRSTKRLLDVLAEMPKSNTTRILDAQRQRQNISKKSEKYAPSTVYLQVLGSGARGAPNTLYVFTDQKRYLFNCGESTQRLAHEHKVKLSRLEHIFITAKSWMNIGGLPGLSLTLQDVGVPKLTLHGPEGLDELYQATKRFVIMKDMDVKMAQCSPAADFEDNVMSVKYVILSPEDLPKDLKPVAKKPKLEEKPKDWKETKELEKFINDKTDYYRSGPKPAAKKPKEQVKSQLSPDRDSAKAKPHKESHNKSTVAYICTLKKRLGTLDLAKCVELGVPPGPMLGQLKAGFDVVLPNGKLVLSKDVKTPDDPGPVFIVLEVPDLSYLKETEFSAHFGESNPPERVPALVVHYTPPHVFRDPRYRKFIAMFGTSTKHLVLNTQNHCLGSEAVHRTQHKLHLLDSDIFPLLRDASIPAVWNSSPLLTANPTKVKALEELKNKIAYAQFQNIISIEGSKGDSDSKAAQEQKYEIYEAKTLSILHLRPKKDIDRSSEPKLHIQEYIQETMDIDGFTGSLEAFRKQVNEIRYLQSDSDGAEFPKVIFLGTGSCIPSKTRNTSAIVLQVDENRSMLLDCGEGTFGQLVRFFGPKRVNSFLRTLRAIYISHLHADHHIGLIGVLQARRQAFTDYPTPETEVPYEPVHLLAPGQIMSWLNMYDLQFEKIRHDYNLIPNQSLLHTNTTEEEMTSVALASIGVEKIKTCLVSHCPNAFGVAIEVDQENKITYSGDTIPCQELVRIGEKSTLLIHEATMEDELAEEARTKMHSTTSQAIEQGRSMQAKYTVLTHFSQRYARLPRLNANILNDNRTVGIAFDNMQITMSDLQLLPLMYAPLLLMFADHCVEMEAKAQHRALAKERRRERSPAASIASCNRSNSSRSRMSESTHSATVGYRESKCSRLRQKVKGPISASRIPRSASDSRSAHRSQSRQPCGPKSSRPKSSDRPVVQSSMSKSRGSLRTSSPNSDQSSVCSSNADKLKYVESPYGKPLVTNINKRLKIMRYTPTPILFNSQDRNKVKQPTPTVRSSVRSVYKPPAQDTSKAKISNSRSPSGSRSIKSASSSRESSQSSTVQKRSEVKSKIPTRCTTPGNKLRPTSAKSSVHSEKNIAVADRYDSAKFGNSSSLEKQSPERRKEPRRFEPVRDMVTERLKEPMCKNQQPLLAGRPHSGSMYKRAYKPQLEDIKSSFLLLNKQTKDQKKAVEEDAKVQRFVKKTPVITEQERRDQLKQIKKKFQSRSFFIDSKYDKIEGLNWISWN